MSDEEGYSTVAYKSTMWHNRRLWRHQPFRFLDLPREIRDEIYRLCFERPIGISPAFNYARRKIPVSERVGNVAWKNYSKYKCQWDGRRELLPIEDGDYDTWTPVVGEENSVMAYWTSFPTPAQALLLSRGIRYLPDTEANSAEGIYTNIEHRASKRHDGAIEIINSQKRMVLPLFGVSLLRTNQQVYNEGIKVFYGNTFIINTAFLHSDDCLDTEHHLYPGFDNKDGSRASAADNTRRIHKLLRRCKQPKFSKHDPLLTFLRKIGPYCSSLIHNIKINGQFMTEIDLRHDSKQERRRYYDKLPFADILGIYTYILQELCPNLRTLTLHQSTGTRYEFNHPDDSERSKWSWVVDDDREDDERISEIVEKVARGLPALKRLQLGYYSSPWEPAWEDSGESSEAVAKDEWGVAIKWSTFVQDRERNRVSEERRSIGIGNNVVERSIQGRVFKLRPAQTVTEADQESVQGRQDQSQQKHAKTGSKTALLSGPSKHFHAAKTSCRPNERQKVNAQHDRKKRPSRASPLPKVTTKSQNPFALLMEDDEDDEDES